MHKEKYLLTMEKLIRNPLYAIIYFTNEIIIS